jgi:hypothetical protein
MAKLKKLRVRDKDKDPLILALYELLQNTGVSHAQAAKDGDTAPQTLHNWFFGDTLTPNLKVYRRVVRGQGWDINQDLMAYKSHNRRGR